MRTPQPPPITRRSPLPGLQPGMPPRRAWWIFVFILLLNYFLARTLYPQPDEPVTVPYTLFKEQIAKDNVKAIYSKGTSIEGEDVRKTVAVQLAEAGDGRKRLAAAGLTITALGEDVRVAAVRFGSRAKKSGFEQGFEVAAVKVPTDRPSEHWVYVPALALIAFVYFLQRSRVRRRARR